MTSKVLIHGRKVDFGQCCCFLLSGHGEKETDFDVSAPLRVHWDYNSQTCELNLTLAPPSLNRGATTPFQHFISCPAYYHNKPNPKLDIKIGVATLLESQKTGRILITQRHSKLRSFPNVWVVPGGHVEIGESLFQAARREVLEETGFPCSSSLNPEQQQHSETLLGIWESAFPHLVELGPMTHHHAVCYVHSWLRREDEEAMDAHVQAAEVQAIAWLTPEQVLGVITKGASAAKDVEVYRVASHHQKLGAAHNWEEKRAKVMLSEELVNCGELYESMSAGTHFVMRKWLEQSHAQSLL